MKDPNDLLTAEFPDMETRQINHLRRQHETAIAKTSKQSALRAQLQEEHGKDQSRKRGRRHARRLAPLDAAEQG